MRKRLDEWRKEAAVNKNLTTSSNARFFIVFNGGSDNSLAAHAAGVLERAFQRIAENIGAYPSNRILVTLYTEQQFRDITHGPAWSTGAFDGKVRIPVKGVSQDREQFDQVLVHELAHAIIDGLAPQGVPAWLHEGLASYFEPEDAALAQRRVQSSGIVIPFSELQESFGRLDATRAVAAYSQARYRRRSHQRAGYGRHPLAGHPGHRVVARRRRRHARDLTRSRGRGPSDPSSGDQRPL